MTMISQLEALGVPVPAAGDGPLETRVLVHSAEQLRSLLDLGLDADGRQAHHTALFGDVTPDSGTAAADDGGASVLRRVTAHVFGNRELSAEDQAEIAPIFPLTVHASVATGPLTVSSRLDLSRTDGAPVIVAYTNVTLLQGGYIVCQGTPLVFTCETLSRIGDSGTADVADFNILGRTGAAQLAPATPGAAGQAASGAPGQCSSVGIAGQGGGAGNPGAAGTPGTDGAHGNQGTPSMPTTITISKTLTATQLTVFTQSGAGGQGGDGGQGGAGQQGGNGGNGVTCDCTGNGGGAGGDGGHGGPGGRAGDGGNGVDATANVVIRVPAQQDAKKVVTSSAFAPPGGPGHPGPGGAGGAGGGSSSGGKNNSGGSGGGTGSPGATGGLGVAGTVYGKPAQFSVGPL